MSIVSRLFRQPTPDTDAAPWWSVLLAQYAGTALAAFGDAQLQKRIADTGAQLQKRIDAQGQCIAETAGEAAALRSRVDALTNAAASMDRRLFIAEQNAGLDPQAPTALAIAAARGDLDAVRRALAACSPEKPRGPLSPCDAETLRDLLACPEVQKMLAKRASARGGEAAAS